MSSPDTSALAEMNAVGEAPRFKELDEWLCWQEGLHFTAIELGLDRCRQVAERMHILQPGFKVLTVAGTNGKGSSVTMLDMILKRSGYRTGKYTSPHLLRYNERICVDGVEASDEDICAAFDRIDKARGDISLTYFEFGTLAALDVFCQKGVDIAIMEVGLGGRLDAVNILDSHASLITSIDIDHENWLGHDRDSVGREKAGIIRANCPSVCSDPEPPESVVQYAEECGVHLDTLGSDFNYVISENSWSWESAKTKYTALVKPTANNDCQIQNASGVLMILDRIASDFPVSKEAVVSTMQDFRLHGRFQMVPGKVPYILDVAHNREAAELLVQNLEKLPMSGETHCVIGLFKDKNHDLIFNELNKIVDHWYISDLESDRAEKARLLTEKLRNITGSPNIHNFVHVDKAMDEVSRRTKPGDRIVVTGSFLTVKAAILRLRLDH